MKKVWIKPLILVVIFIGAVITFSIFTNKSNEDLTTSMPEATLPVLYFTSDGTQINGLHGYVQKMDETAMRDSILPVGDDRMMDISIASYGYNVKKLSYEVRSMDGSRLVADGEVSDFTTDGQTLKAQIQLQNILEEDEEYVLVFLLH